jgi:surfactin synthase thioesterase subunit
MPPPAVLCDPELGCGTLRTAVSHQKEQDRRLAGAEEEIRTLHSRITEEIKQKVTDNRAFVLFALSLGLQILFHYWK